MRKAIAFFCVLGCLCCFTACSVKPLESSISVAPAFRIQDRNGNVLVDGDDIQMVSLRKTEKDGKPAFRVSVLAVGDGVTRMREHAEKQPGDALFQHISDRTFTFILLNQSIKDAKFDFCVVLDSEQEAREMYRAITEGTMVTSSKVTQTILETALPDTSLALYADNAGAPLLTSAHIQSILLTAGQHDGKPAWNNIIVLTDEGREIFANLTGDGETHTISLHNAWDGFFQTFEVSNANASGCIQFSNRFSEETARYTFQKLSEK